MELVVLAALLGFIPAAIASKKGHRFFSWWLFGALLFIVALPLALIAEDRTSDEYLVNSGDRRECPHCAAPIRNDVAVCRHCGRDVEVVVPRDETAFEPADELEEQLLDYVSRCPKSTTYDVVRALKPHGRSEIEQKLWHLRDQGQLEAITVIGAGTAWDLQTQR